MTRLRHSPSSREALTLMRSGMSFDQVAKELGYRERGGARKVVMAALQRSVMEDADEIRRLEISGIDAILAVLCSRSSTTHRTGTRRR